MLNSVPRWLQSLQPRRTPELERLSKYSSQLAWHVDTELRAWAVPIGRLLTGSQTWNGKALVISSDSNLECSVGEVEVAERLRTAFPDFKTYWTAGRGNPPAQWRDWALTPKRRQHEEWLLNVDRSIREGEPHLASNDRGWPDVLSWRTGKGDLLCVEYKGPRPSSPTVLDEISLEQDAWFRAGLQQGLLELNRYAVVRWVPSSKAKSFLLQQAQARALRKSDALRSSKLRAKGSAASAARVQDRRGAANDNMRHGISAAAPHSSAAAEEHVEPTPTGRRAALSAERVGAVIWFPAGEAGAAGKFKRWREENPRGFVVNLRSPRNAMFHIARCHTLGEPWPPEFPMPNGKIAAVSLAELEKVAASEQWSRRICGYCARFL